MSEEWPFPLAPHPLFCGWPGRWKPGGAHPHPPASAENDYCTRTASSFLEVYLYCHFVILGEHRPHLDGRPSPGGAPGRSHSWRTGPAPCPPPSLSFTIKTFSCFVCVVSVEGPSDAGVGLGVLGDGGHVLRFWLAGRWAPGTESELLGSCRKVCSELDFGGQFGHRVPLSAHMPAIFSCWAAGTGPGRRLEESD